jgi:hypothetical protein
MRRTKWIPTLGVALISALLANSTPALQAKETAGIRPTFNMGNKKKWKHAPNQIGGRRAAGLGITNPFKGRSLPKLPSINMPQFGSMENVEPKVILDDKNRAYLTKAGPVGLAFSGDRSSEFDRNNIKYVEHQGEFPGTPAKPSPSVHAKAPPPPVPAPPPVGKGVAESAPVIVSTKPQTLGSLLNAPGNTPAPPPANGILFHKKVDHQSATQQEIITPFALPYVTRPPVIGVQGKATYIRE